MRVHFGEYVFVVLRAFIWLLMSVPMLVSLMMAGLSLPSSFVTPINGGKVERTRTFFLPFDLVFTAYDVN